MADLGIEPIWDDAVELPEFAPLISDISVDVAVVGAGLTGITTAFLLHQAGRSVALLERRHAGGVDTGCTTAHLTAVIDTDLPALASTFGRDHAQAVWDAGLAAIDQIDAIVQRHEIACEFHWVPGFRHVPFDADARVRARDLDKLREEATLARDLGFDVEMIATTPLGDLPGWRIENQAVFHPRRYLQGLLAHLMTSDRVTCAKGDVHVDGTTLTCGPHTVRASQLVIATHTPIAGRLSAAAAGILHSTLAHYTSYAIAARVAPPVATPPACYWDTASPYHYIRVDEDGDGLRLIVGGEDHKTGQEPDTTKPFAALEQWLGRFVPMASTTHRWSGRVIETPDGLPLIGEIAERQYIATGFAGNGMTFGTLSAMLICDAITGARNPWRELFDVNRSAIARGPLDYLRENADYPYYLARDRFAGAESRSLRSVSRGEGQLIEIDGQVVAASRDANGKLTVVSPTCTHLGCRVSWNTAEKTWDCPCHGSRFADNGEVLAGPAERPLEPVTLRARTAKASR